MDLKGAHPVEVSRILFCRSVTLSLGRDHMHQNRSLQVIGIVKGLHQKIQPVAVDGADILESKGLKEHARGKEGDKRVLALSEEIQNVLPHPRKGPDEVLQFPAKIDESFARHLAADKGGEGPNIGGDAHGIVIEDNNEVPLCMTGLVQTFKGHAGCHGSISNDRDHSIPLPLEGLCGGDPKARGDGGAAVACIKGVVGAFRTLGKATNPPMGPKGLKLVPPAGDQFMGIRLMSHVPNDLISRGIKDIVKGQGQFHHPEAWGQVPTVLGHCLNDGLTNLPGQDLQLG